MYIVCLTLAAIHLRQIHMESLYGQHIEIALLGLLALVDACQFFIFFCQWHRGQRLAVSVFGDSIFVFWNFSHA